MLQESMSCRVVGLIGGILLSLLCVLHVRLAVGISRDSVLLSQRLYLTLVSPIVVSLLVGCESGSSCLSL